MPTPPLPVRLLRRRRTEGFTLIELLVVIGIIVVLMGILIPVASHVRQTAYNTSTQSQLLVIQQGIEAYRQVFEAYPGPLAESQLLPNMNPAKLGGPATGSENLVLGLAGALQLNAGNITYVPALVGQGPFSLNPLKSQRSQAFVDLGAAGLDTVKSSNAWVNWKDPAHANVTNQISYSDTPIPEFVDRFPDALPILYIRARLAATATVTDGASNYPAKPPGLIPAYDMRQLYPYSFPKLPMAPSPNVLSAAEYFGTLADTSVPKQKDGYLLISAGIDRKYGTLDDITSAGKVK